MEPFFVFLVRSSAGIALFYIVYWIFLRNETFHHANRWYFIGALSSSILLPLFPLRYVVPLEQVDNTIIFQALNENIKSFQPVYPTGSEASPGIGLINILTAVYLSGAFLVLLRLLIQTGVLINLLAQSRIAIKEGIRIAENKKYNTAFTFFNILFINPEFFRGSDLPKIIAHEKVHIREHHWCDLVVIELFTVVFWFNPFIWFYEHSIRQNHEYLADEGVISMGYSEDQYCALLLNQSFGIQVIGLTNCFNFALNKNRFKMMTKKKTSRLRSLKFLVALPVLGAMLFECAEPWYQNQDSGEGINDGQISESTEIFEIFAEIVDEYGNPIPGVSVVIKGTTIGTITNPEGVFKLKLPLANDLVLSYVGKETIIDDLSDITSTGPVRENYQRSYVMREGVFNIDREKHFSPPPPPPPSPVRERVSRVRPLHQILMRLLKSFL
jgi:hypothetical protein